MKKRSYEKRKQLYGYGFIALWLIGTFIFFIIPIVKSLIYSLSDVNIGNKSMVTSFSGMKNYYNALFSDRKYSSVLWKTLKETLWKTPLIIIFSLFIAVILNNKFKGRTFFRAVFFLPVIIATGPVYSIISGDMADTGNIHAEQFSTLFSNNLVGELLQFLGIYGITEKMNDYIILITDNIFSIVWSSGIQIIIFLAALQNIPTSAREAAEIEGAGAWDFFWKITFPYVSPFILANFIFTVIDAFSNPSNAVMKRIFEIRSDLNFGLAAAMAWIYFAIVFIIISLVSLISRKMIYYENEEV
ncbi:MAG: sugar ABC transporter permease [Ruminococcus sp.]|nr:sugar ABC transporter permease [Ruminococcus sp.]MBO5383799.1 sugar ABC transporter permease [Ruminococcus sp.]